MRLTGGDCGSTKATFTLTLSAASGEAVTVDDVTAGGAATGDGDEAIRSVVNGGKEGAGEDFLLDLFGNGDSLLGRSRGVGMILKD